MMVKYRKNSGVKKRNNTRAVNDGTRIWVKFLNWFHCVNSLFLFPLPFQVYRMFSVWYGHYPYQVAEYDECPMSGSWDAPRPLSIMWRPWFSEDMDLFHFFQVDVLTHFVLIEIMVVGWGVMESPYLKKQRDSCGHWRDKVLEETPDTWGSLSWSLCLKKGPSCLIASEESHCERLCAASFWP